MRHKGLRPNAGEHFQAGLGARFGQQVVRFCTSLHRAGLHAIWPVADAMIGHVSQVRLPVRTTYATATQMIQGASEEIIVVGYVFTEGASALVELLAAAQTDRKVLVTIIGNRMRDQLSRLKGMWPAVTPLPAVFSRERLADDPLATLHAKLLLCDRSEALVTSANFSHHGLHANIEIGLHVKSPAIERLSDFLLALINSGEVDSLTEVL